MYRVKTQYYRDFEDLAAKFQGAVPRNLVRVVLLCGVKSDEEYMAVSSSLVSLLDNAHMSHILYTVVAQKPLMRGVGFAVEYHYWDLAHKIEYGTHDGIQYAEVTDSSGEYLFSGYCSSVSDEPRKQAVMVFDNILKVIKSRGYRPSDIFRQWNYVPNIIAINPDGSQNYQLLNDARSAFYSLDDWSKGYPAATGIGTSFGGISVDVCLKKENDTIKVDNPLQIPAHAYSEEKLEKGVEKVLTTPKFERARIMKDRSVLFISGTAAIRGENSLVEDVREQTIHTLENISELALGRISMDAEHTDHIRVYIKREDDFPVVREIVEKKFPNFEEVSYVSSDVCRDNLLVEIEIILRKNAGE